VRAIVPLERVGSNRRGRAASGLVGPAAMTRLLTTFLFESKPYASVAALLGVMSTLALCLPALRWSSKVDRRSRYTQTGCASPIFRLRCKSPTRRSSGARTKVYRLPRR
jgi:hypothetical protein